jgi:hypothetical protein
MLVYRALYETFGFRSTLPLRLVAILSGAAIPVAVYVAARARVAPPLALVAAAAMTWYPGYVPRPSAFNHWLAAAGCVACAWAIVRPDRRLDLPLGAALTFALCNSPAGVAGAVACLVFAGLVRPSRRRWLVVVVPSLGWLAWWLFLAPHHHAGRPLGQAVHVVVNGVAASFRGLGAGNRAVGVALAVVFAGLAGGRLRRGPAAAANARSWTAGLVFWWAALAYSRPDLGTGDIPARYRIVGSVFVILAALPERRPDVSAARRGPASPDAGHAEGAGLVPEAGRRARPGAGRLAPLTVVAGLVLAAVVVLANRGAVLADARALDRESAVVRAGLTVANLGPSVLPDRAGIDVGFLNGKLRAGTYRTLVAKWGTPPRTRPAHPDAVLAGTGALRPAASAAGTRPCAPLGSGARLPPTSATRVRAGSRPVRVRIRRFERRWTTVGHVPAGAIASIRLAGFGASTPWRIDAPGLCRLADGPATRIVVPAPGSVVHGTTPLGATPSPNVYVTAVEFRLTGGAYRDHSVGTAVLAYGWVARWDTRSVPNGAYTLTSVATDSVGTKDVSPGVRVVVRN